MLPLSAEVPLSLLVQYLIRIHQSLNFQTLMATAMVWTHQDTRFHQEAPHRESIPTCMMVIRKLTSAWQKFQQFYITSHRSQTSPKPMNTSIPPDSQSTYLVFESALLLLFTICRYCANTTTDVKRATTGSFLRISQFCGKCKQTWCWESQPYIGKIPAGNIYLSAAILYAGAFPAKVLRIFHILKCAVITSKTFFRHQRMILQPAIHLTWERHQLSLFQTLKARNRNLVLAGDGRADSPGHSAKYGSYTVIEMSCNKVVDFKLVQVWMY